MKINRQISTLLIITILLIYTNLLFAKQVDPDIVQNVALNAYSKCKGSLKSDLNILEKIIVSEKEKNAFTIFNFKEGGFIIVSNNDASEPILGYGFNSRLNLDSIPPGLKYLLNEYKNEILSINENQTTNSLDLKEKWEMYSNYDEINMTNKSYTIGTYLLSTTWDQASGYQELCPIDPLTNYTSKVGCGGVALGQILYYWGCRVFPDGSISYLPDNFQNNISLNFYGQTYNWSTMNTSSPDSENKKLLYHSAVSIESDFGYYETESDANAVPFGLWNYWGFNSQIAKDKNDYLSTWNSLLRNEIDNGRPIFYGGMDTTVNPNIGHGWVVDGYRTSDNKYHCNWGWGGSFNEWFTLTDLTPDTENYNSSQFAIMGIYPKLDACSGLTGSTLICSSASYSISIPSTASVVWSKSSNLSQVGGNTSTTYSVSAVTGASGSGSVTATIKNSQGQTFLTRTKTVWVGVPGTPITSPSGYPTLEIGLGTYQPISLYSTPGFTGGTINWWSTGSIQPAATTSSTICTFEAVSLGTGNFYVTVQNTCGTSPTGGGTVNVVSGGGGELRVVLSPNPSTLETTASIEAISTETVFDENAEWELEVYDNSQNQKLKKEKMKGNSTKIQTSGWKEGIYIVRVKYKNEILTEKLVVKK